jgi:serine/threonine protein kinase
MTEADQRLLTLFSAALDLAEGPDRIAYLDRACGDDRTLRAHVERLLVAHANVGQFMEREPNNNPEEQTPATIAVPGPTAGAIIADRYKLLEVIGEGGMGTVWLADQSEPVRRKVALKLIKAGIDSKQVVARFEAERQALALMDHTNIAKVLDGGVTADGYPYFVMELVKGVPITRYCDEHQLTPRARLELFVPVCQAVQHAHQKGIIHRDLKPSNVLVAPYDGRPVPKVIDFGVAKAAGQPLTEKTLFTSIGAVVGTLEYMSPEQAELNQLDVDTRSDLYSLGVLLYELLTGTTPFDRKRLKAVALLEMLRVIREEEPPKPSTRLSTSEGLPSIAANRGLEPKKLSGMMRGDLDWIVMRCLEKDRARRYESANGLALDLQRYLADEPVSAGAPSRLYRLRKFVRRNKAPVLFACVLVASLLAGTAISIWQAVRATALKVVAQQERDAANIARADAATDRDRAEAVLTFFEDEIVGQANPVRQAALDHVPDPNVKLRTILDRAARKMEGSFKQQPQIEGTIRKTIGETYLSLGEPAAARPHLERALVIVRQEYGENHAYTMNALGSLAMVSLMEGEFDAAVSAMQTVLDTSAQFITLDNPVRPTLLNNLAMAYSGKGNQARAVELMLQAIDGYRRRVGEDHVDTLTAMNNLGLIYQRQKIYDLAESWFLKAMEGGQRALGEASPMTIAAMFNLLTSYSDQGKFDKAEPFVDTLLRLGPQVFGDDHPRTLDIRNNCGEVLIETKDDARLEPVLLKLMEFGPRIRGENHYQTLVTLNEMALLHVRKGRFAEAEPLFAKNVDGMGRVKGPNDPATLTAVHSLIFVLEKQGKHAEAEPLHRRLVAAELKKSGADSQPTAQATYQLGRCLIRQKKFADAEPVFRDCLKVFESDKPSGWSAGAKRFLGESLAGQKKFSDAEPLILAGYEGFKALDPTPDHKRIVLDSLEVLVRFYDEWGKKEKADEWRKVLAKTKSAAKP